MSERKNTRILDRMDASRLARAVFESKLYDPYCGDVFFEVLKRTYNRRRSLIGDETELRIVGTVDDVVYDGILEYGNPFISEYSGYICIQCEIDYDSEEWFFRGFANPEMEEIFCVSSQNLECDYDELIHYLAEHDFHVETVWLCDEV